VFTKRIIPCLDVKNGRVVKGVNFVDLKDAGDPVEIAKAYDKAGADELVFLDITASSDARNTVVDMVRKVAEQVHIDIPTPSELELAEESAGDPVALLAHMLQKSGKKEDPVMVMKLKEVMTGMQEQKTALPGSSEYKNQLFQVLKNQLRK
jgi:hypothetical protein